MQLNPVFYRNTKGLGANLLVKNLKSQFIYNPWLRNIVMKTDLPCIHIHKP